MNSDRTTDQAASLPRQSQPTIETIIECHLNRRAMLRGAAAAAGSLLCAGSFQTATSADTSVEARGEVPHVYPARPGHAERAKSIEVADDHFTQVLLRWGDPILPGAPQFDSEHQSPAAQLQQFGYNNDFVAFLPLPRGSRTSDHGLLCVNMEYTNPELMFTGITADNKFDKLTPEQLTIEMAAHGHAVVEIRRSQADGKPTWSVEPSSRYNRRISALQTEMRIKGPAAGHPRLRTAKDPTGTRVIGTLNNCAGGTTPWGTVLFAEENFHQYFTGNAAGTAEAKNHARYGIGSETNYAWHRIDERFDVAKHPREPNRFGWVVEYDPYDPSSVPVKRTALGRFRHEGAAVSVNHDGRVVVYLGDDERFDYLYKFVSKRAFDAGQPQSNADVLDDGTLLVARFDEDGTVRWLPLVFGQGPLTEANGFASQADVLIETRRAADLLGATPMDRPEDVEGNPKTENVYVILTNNTKRTNDQVDAANPRAKNAHGHIIELVTPKINGKPDHAAEQHEWNVFLRAGEIGNDGGWYQGHKPAGWLSCPDNCTFDLEGRLWIATDGAPKAAGFTDGVYACDVEGPNRARTRQFFRAPIGAEICGPCFTPDCTTLFVAIQHPAEGSTRDAPSTRWPNDAASGLPPQPSVVAIMRKSDQRPVG